MRDCLFPWLVPAIITATILPASSQVTIPITVTVSPDRPVLGDTLAIVVNASEQPTVEVAGKALPGLFH